MSKAEQRFYLMGRRAAEDEYDTDDYDLAELATKVLDGADLRATLAEAVAAEIAFDNFDGSVKEWEEDYEDELEEHGIEDKRAAREQWRRGFLDEAAYQLEDEVLDEIEDLLEEEEDEDDKPRRSPRKNPDYDYSYVAKDGTRDARNWWDESFMHAYVKAAKAKVDASGWAKQADLRAQIDQAAAEQAERAMTAIIADGARDSWLEQEGKDIRDEGGNPEVAYDQHYMPRFRRELERKIAEQLEDSSRWSD